MIDYAKLSLEELIKKEGYDCECGKHHAAPIEYLKIERGALKYLPEAIQTLGVKKPFVVCDDNTWKVAGEKVAAILKENNIPYTVYVVPTQEDRLKPGEWEVGSMAMHFDTSCDLILGVGGGVINDLSKVLARTAGCKSAIVGTAPSMDGYASDTGAMEINKVKVSVYGAIPAAIILDVDIMVNAPMRLLWAGLGDMVAKYTALCEWRFAKLIIGEYYCEGLAKLMREALRKVTSSADKLSARDPEAIQSVAEGLVIAGIAMAFAGSSRPASGLEHYFSHMWEMMALERDKPYDLHGIQVGIGTLLAMKVLKQMRTINPTKKKAEAFFAAFDEAEWEKETMRIFGRTGEQIVIAEHSSHHKNELSGARARMNKIVDNWDEICKIIDEELPDYEWLEGLMRGTGMPLKAQDIGIGIDDVRDAFVGSREIRNKYLACSMLWDLGFNAEFADWIYNEEK